MIPQCKTWKVTVLGDDNKVVTYCDVIAPTKFLARLNFRHDYIQFWGYNIKIGLPRK